MIRLVDWFMILPDDLEDDVRDQLDSFEQERQMPYVTSFERLARKEGREEGQLGEARLTAMSLLTKRFGELPPELRQRIEAADPEACRDLIYRAWDARSITDLLD